MSEHVARIRWYRNTRSFAYDDYDRRHSWLFDSGTEIIASAAPAFLGNADCVDPEEAFVASLSACHMLTLLAIASRKQMIIDRYLDEATGFLAKNSHGKLAVTRVILRPEIVFSGDKMPTADQLSKLHESAHKNCFIANSVNTEIIIEAR